jgi:hypothetical protein
MLLSRLRGRWPGRSAAEGVKEEEEVEEVEEEVLHR